MSKYKTVAEIRDEAVRTLRLSGVGYQKRFAKKHGMSEAYLSDFLNGRRGAGQKILTALGYSPEAYYTRATASKSKKVIKTALFHPRDNWGTPAV